jgi:hypothetical protein
MADPRWPVLQRQLAAFAHEVSCPWDGGLQGWMQWQPTDCRTLCWNEIAQNMSAAAIDAAVYAPTRKHFPKCKGANFAHWHSDPTAAGTWAFNFESVAHTGLGFGAHAGTHSSGSWYAEPAQPRRVHEHDFGFGVGAKFVVTLPSRAGTNGSTRAQPRPYCKVAAVTPFNQLVFDVRKARNIASGNVRAARPAEGTMAWVAPKRGMDVLGKGYNSSPGVYHGSDYYQEALFHIALSGCVEMFVYYHGWAETPWDIGLGVMSAALAEVDAVLGVVTGTLRRPASMAPCVSHSVDTPLEWDASHVASGAHFDSGGRRQLWRVSFRSPLNLGSAAQHPNNVKVLSTDPFTYWPTGTGEWFALEPVPGARCVFSGCLQPNASSALGVWLVRDEADDSAAVAHAPGRALKVVVGLGRIVALHCHSSTLYRIRENSGSVPLFIERPCMRPKPACRPTTRLRARPRRRATCCSCGYPLAIWTSRNCSRGPRDMHPRRSLGEIFLGPIGIILGRRIATVLKVLIDDLGYADVGYHGEAVGSAVSTPAIDALVRPRAASLPAAQAHPCPREVSRPTRALPAARCLPAALAICVVILTRLFPPPPSVCRPSTAGAGGRPAREVLRRPALQPDPHLPALGPLPLHDRDERGGGRGVRPSLCALAPDSLEENLHLYL